MNNKKQPLSPHLTVYKPQITSIMSISHRIAGFFQTIGTFIIFVYILALFIGEGFYNYIDFFITSLLGKMFVFLYFFSICYHFCNGIRHLTWDLGYGFEIKTTKITGLIVIFGSLILTVVFYLIGKNFF